MVIRRATERVYPRPRGGTMRTVAPYAHPVGLSPPTRGNRLLPLPWASRLRSIPAHAGEPIMGYTPASSAGSIPAHAGEPQPNPPPIAPAAVYPRPRGGTPMSSICAPHALGLSPPTRGNLQYDGRPDPDLGSIPAHAGEPRSAPESLPWSWVYPRPRGGTLPNGSST